MAWGGARIGAGRKPKQKDPVSPFAVFPGRKLTDRREPIDLSALLESPKDLPPDQQAFWCAHAALAIERKTLTPATVPAFRLLCELQAKKAMVGQMVDKGALGGLRIFLQLAKQVETLMARFCLAPFGKPVPPAEKPKGADEDDAFFGGASVGGR